MKMDKITGNFLTQANKDFPLDCETLDYLQKLAALAALAGNTGGDKVVLHGCEADAEGTRRGAGYVFLRTRSYPEGEVLPWEGGPTTGGMYLRQEDMAITANNTGYPKAYTRRSLAPGIGEENYRWEDFSEIKTNRELAAEAASLREELAGLRRAPLGIVEMWAGTTVPEGYLLCDGGAYRIADYTELHAAIGTTFNEAADASGAKVSTDPGMFRVPDLRGRFIVGRHDSDGDYQATGAAGGLKKVALTEEEIPRHAHRVKDYYYAQAPSSMQTHNVKNYDTIPKHETGNNGIGDKESDEDNDCMPYYEHDSYPVGGGGTHENRPPYYVLAYIMRAK